MHELVSLRHLFDGPHQCAMCPGSILIPVSQLTGTRHSVSVSVSAAGPLTPAPYLDDAKAAGLAYGLEELSAHTDEGERQSIRSADDLLPA